MTGFWALDYLILAVMLASAVLVVRLRNLNGAVMALEAAFKILVLTTMASFAIFVGAGLLYAKTGALNFGQLHAALRGHLSTPETVAFGLLIAGFATKAGLVPFHGWLADAHTAAPGPVSALFGLMVNLGVVAIGRLAFQVYSPGSTPVLGLLMTVGLISAVAGALLALAQDDLKRLLAYDTVSQVGIMIIGLAAGSAAGVAGAGYHLVNHAGFKALMFLCTGVAVDSSHLCWTNHGDDTIWEANLNGSNPQVIVTNQSGLFGVAVGSQ
jgi:multicomponent Na+:H+ antiporter subunit D